MQNILLHPDTNSGRGRRDIFHFRSFGTCWSFLPCIAMQREEQNLFKVVVGWSSLLCIAVHWTVCNLFHFKLCRPSLLCSRLTPLVVPSDQRITNSPWDMFVQCDALDCSLKQEMPRNESVWIERIMQWSWNDGWMDEFALWVVDNSTLSKDCLWVCSVMQK